MLEIVLRSLGDCRSVRRRAHRSATANAPGRSGVDARTEQILEADVLEHLTAHAVADAEHLLGAVLRRIDEDAVGTLAEGRVDDVGDRGRDGAGIGIGRLQSRKALQRLLDAGLTASVTPSCTSRARRASRSLEVFSSRATTIEFSSSKARLRATDCDCVFPKAISAC
ncbi:hypothetical protein [Labrys okinawensis]|uniref:hypothetical protein n=1 Tax=Labrys okinawensis TaxID=346911 RepID=UPI0015E4261F